MLQAVGIWRVQHSDNDHSAQHHSGKVASGWKVHEGADVVGVSECHWRAGGIVAAARTHRSGAQDISQCKGSERGDQQPLEHHQASCVPGLRRGEAKGKNGDVQRYVWVEIEEGGDSVNKHFYPRSDALGLKQCLGILAVVLVTGAASVVLFRCGYWITSILCLILHGNICSLFSSAVHELAHGTVFESKKLNGLFLRVFEFLNWTNAKQFMATHVSHHKHTLHDDDMERVGSCRKLWIGTWVWSSLFNLPRFIVSAWRFPACAMLHAVIGFALVSTGNWDVAVVIHLAPFLFGWLELFVNYPQHAGLPLNGTAHETTRSMQFPAWLSFLNWHMELHLEHHIYPSVPCYRLRALRQDLNDTLPALENPFAAWAFIFRQRSVKGKCGSPRTAVALLTITSMFSVWCHAAQVVLGTQMSTTTTISSPIGLITVPPFKQTLFTWDAQPAGTSNKVYWGTVRGYWTNGNTIINTNVFPYTNGSVYKVTGILAGVESPAIALWPSNRYDRVIVQTSTNLLTWQDGFVWQTNYNRPQEYLRLRSELIRWE
jgi:fatty acid desaturase